MLKRELKPRPLSARERSICLLLLEGANNREISSELGISYGVVKNRLGPIYDKLCVRDRVQLIVHYGKNGGKDLGPVAMEGKRP